MSAAFQHVMRDISATLRRADSLGEDAGGVAVVPGGGTYAMEAVARQLAGGKKALVIRNGWFSYRWTQIFDAGQIPAESLVLKARPVAARAQAPFHPRPSAEALAGTPADHPGPVLPPHHS